MAIKKGDMVKIVRIILGEYPSPGEIEHYEKFIGKTYKVLYVKYKNRFELGITTHDTESDTSLWAPDEVELLKPNLKTLLED